MPRLLMDTSGCVLSTLALVLTLSAHGAESVPPAGEGEFLSEIRQLTLEGKRSGEGYFSPDGKSLVFQSERDDANPFYQIYLLSFESGEITRVSPGLGKTTCAYFRPGAQEILFASTHLDPQASVKQKAEADFRASGKQRRYAWDYDEQMDLFSAAPDGSAVKRLTDAPGYDAEGSYSPDGQNIVFTSLRHAYPSEKLSPEDQKRLQLDPAHFAEIYLMNADGTGQKRLTWTPGYDGGPFFSPDGQRIVWRRFETNGVVADIFTMKRDGTDVQQVTHFQCMSWAPFYHPSGDYILFTANKLGFSNFELFVVDPAGRHEPVQITYRDGFDGLPTFSPDGEQICWTASRSPDGRSQLFLANWNHRAVLARLRSAPTRTPTTSEGSALDATAASRAKTVSPGLVLSPEINAQEVRAEVEFLASEATEGRMTGSKGARLAATFVAEQLEKAGVEPFPDWGGYFQEFEFNAGVKVLTNENRLTVIANAGAAPVSFEPEKDFRPLSFTANGEVEGPLVFAGYGLSIPGAGADGYDSYAGLDATNKVVMVLRYVPEKVSPQRRQELNRYAGLRYKAMLAREHGAKAILIVAGPNSPGAGELATLSSDSSLAASGIVAVSITGQVADKLLQSSGKSLAARQTALDDENPHAEKLTAVEGVRLQIASAVEHLRHADRNVSGLIRPHNADGVQEFILVGAHYDHLGLGEAGAMLRAGEAGQIHAGADDNASGVSAALELAGALAEERRKNPRAFQHGVIFGLWSGEELGIIGSSYFADHPPVPLSNIVAYVNFDMIGRLRTNRLTLQGVGSSAQWKRLIEKRNIVAGFDLSLQEDPYLPTDVTAFYPKQVPVLNFFTGSHEDYHRPSDRPDKINYEGMARIIKFAHSLVRDLVSTTNRLDYAKVQSSGGATAGQREMLRVYLGTIPDYTTETIGVKLTGVRAGSPAERAGLQAGDTIVEFAGQQIKNVYDYTYALDAVRIGQVTDVIILRAGERKALQVTPEARK